MDVLNGTASQEEVDILKAKMAALEPHESYRTLEESFLQWLATCNPVATTLFYEQLTNAVFSEIVGVPPSGARRKAVPLRSRCRGFLGTGVRVVQSCGYMTRIIARVTYLTHC